MKRIPLLGERGAGKFTLLDDNDYDQFSNAGWYLHPNGYAVIGSVKLHRLIVNAPSGLVVDHINGNRLDNRRCNLRICTTTENNRNAAGASGATSQYKGVYKSGDHKWRAYITVDKSPLQLGTFDTEAKAALAFNAAARVYHGEFAKLNEVDGVEPTLQEIMRAKTLSKAKTSLCPRCKTNEKARNGKYCVSCRSKYMKQWRAGRVKD